MTDIQQNLKIAFSKVKLDISAISTDLNEVKKAVSEQNKQINELLRELGPLKELLKTSKNSSSTGNEGVNQSINHLINQSLNQSINHQSQDTPVWAKKPENESFTPQEPNPEPGDLINQSSINQQENSQFNQSINHLINQSPKEPLKQLTNDISKVFSSLSKQELKLFLTVYQLEDEGIDASYKAISLKMGLSEHCIRSHISSLMRKNVPLIKNRLNNKINILRISPEFKALNLKQRLINFYYNTDPHQKTLFDNI